MDYKEGELGIFMATSRLNHSCNPNAYFEYNGNWRQITVYAIKNIKANEEILVSYRARKWYETTNPRQRKLMRDYEFNCDCAACMGVSWFARSRQATRTDVFNIWTRISQRRPVRDQTIIERRDNLSDLKTLYGLLDSEELAYWALAEVCKWTAAGLNYELTRQQHNSAVEHDRCRELGLEAAREKLYLDIMATGQGSVTVEETLDWMKNLRFGQGLCMAW